MLVGMMKRKSSSGGLTSTRSTVRKCDSSPSVLRFLAARDQQTVRRLPVTVKGLDAAARLPGQRTPGFELDFERGLGVEVNPAYRALPGRVTLQLEGVPSRQPAPAPAARR